MKIVKTVLGGIFFGFFALSSVAYAAQPIDKVVAIVNDGVITQDELDAALSGIKARYTQANTPVPAEAILRKQVLDQLISQKLQLQIAERAGVNVSAPELSDTIARIAKSNHFTLAELQQKIKASGGNYAEFLKNIKQQIMLTKLQRQAAMQDVKITDADVVAAQHELMKKVRAALQYNLMDAVVPADKQNLIPAIKTALGKNTSAADLNKQFPGVTFTDMGWQNPNTLPELFMAALQRAQGHQVIGPVKAPNGLHLLKVVSTKSGEVHAVTKDQAKMYLMQQKSQAVLQKWMDKLRKSAYIKIMNT
jgi:peptidyl-prolyl cis-trans isomerase SurA